MITNFPGGSVSTYDTPTTDGPSSTGEQAKEKAQGTAQQAAGQARGQIRRQVDQRSTEAGEKVSSSVEDVRSVAQQLREQGKDQPAKLAEQAADRAERVGTYLKESDGEAILHDIEDFGRRQPWAVMFGGLAAGFLASRFLKASSSRRYESRLDEGGRLSARRSQVTPDGAPPVASPAPTPVVRREPGVGTPATGVPAEDVSLSGGVMPRHGGGTAQ
jgi:hypothetical protein